MKKITEWYELIPPIISVPSDRAKVRRFLRSWMYGHGDLPYLLEVLCGDKRPAPKKGRKPCRRNAR